MIFAAIDIGSNAIRLQITRIIYRNNKTAIYKTLESIRFPLRLGKDAFRTGEITFRSEIKFINLMMAFRTLIDLYEADDIYACATSAVRDSTNGDRIVQRAYEKSGINIEIISGEREAKILDMAIHKGLDNGHYMQIDVGGGSTELNLIEGGKSYARQSFMLGSVRNMQGKHKRTTWKKMDDWIIENKRKEFDASVATGGNIRSLYEEALLASEELDMATLRAVVKKITTMDVARRISELGLREDRADVIPYASEIYMRAFETAGIEKIRVPNVGLKDGIIEMLVQRNC